jgi:hypothetical protein
MSGDPRRLERISGTCRSRAREPRPIPCEQWRYKAAAFAAARRKPEIRRNVIFNATLSLLMAALVLALQQWYSPSFKGWNENTQSLSVQSLSIDLALQVRPPLME